MSNLRGLRYVAIYRCSTNVQTEKSIPEQQLVVQEYAGKNGMIPAGNDVIQAGVSASKKRQRHDIDQLIARKRQLNDFDVILIHDYSRLTRRGHVDAVLINAELGKHGIKVVSASPNEQIQDGPFRPMAEAFVHSHHNQFARDHAKRVALGQMASILDEQSVGARGWAFGIDRLYVGYDGKKHHIIRVMPDGSQLRIHPETNEILSVYERCPDGKSRFYRRQRDEKVVLIPGDPKSLDLVRRIFKLAIVDGMGYHSIAVLLDREGVPSAHGGSWYKATVQRIIKNPLYTGRLITNRLSAALYFMRSKNGPVAVDADYDGLLFGTGKTRFRPKEDWNTMELPQLKGILDPKLLELAIPFQDRLLEHETAVRNSGIKRDKHSKTSFFLKDVLRMKQDGSPMCGQVANQMKNKGRMYRYYRPRGYGDARYVGTAHNCRTPAEPLEAFVIDMLAQVLARAPKLRDKVKDCVVKEQMSRHEERTRVEELEQKRRNIAKKISTFADLQGDLGEDFEHEGSVDA